MTGKTHFALGLLIGLSTYHIDSTQNLYITLTAASIGSILPDIDSQKSTISQLLKPISKVVDRCTDHRGATHDTLPFVLIILYYLTGIYPLMMLGIGALSHTLLDIITHESKLYCQSRGETIVFYILWILNTIVTILIILKHFHIQIPFKQLLNLFIQLN